MKRWFKVGASFLGVVLFLWFVGFVIFCQTVFGYADDDKAIGAFSQTDEKENENVFRAYQDYAKKVMMCV